MLFAADVASPRADELMRLYWAELADETDSPAKEFATRVVAGVLAHRDSLDERIQRHAEHWRIPRMAIVDRNILRLAVYEFIYEQTPRTVTINEALEVARRFSTFEATQFINGILDAIKRALDQEQPQHDADPSLEEAPPAGDLADVEDDTAPDVTSDDDDEIERDDQPLAASRAT